AAVVCILLLSQVLELARLCLHGRQIQHTRWYYGAGPCAKDKKDRLSMVDLVNKTFRVLRGLGVEPVLCYGTLWGALRHGDILPWDDNVDMCARASDLNRVTVQSLHASFRAERIALGTYSWWHGHFKLELDTAYLNSPPGYLPTTQPAPQRWACPSGVSFHAFYRMDDVYRPFPMWLIDPPFSNASLAGVTVSVPHDGIEIQKYMYPGDWWLTTRPQGCDQ
ncbi:unnamed protein product, partial [Lymnaea stagnalis]